MMDEWYSSSVIGINTSALYYPSFNAPDSWLKNSLLYFDEVSTIIPYQRDQSVLNSSQTYLAGEGFYRPAIVGHPGMQEWELHELADEVLTYAMSNEGEREIASSTEAFYIDRAKFSHFLRHDLKRRGFLTPSAESGFDRVPAPLAIFYMARLADLVCKNDAHHLLPSTDHSYTHALMAEEAGGDKVADAVRIVIKGMLPPVRDDVPLRSVVEFRREHEDELRPFRVLVRSFASKISKASGTEEEKAVLAEVADQIVSDVRKFENKTDTVLGDKLSSCISFITSFGAPGTIAGILNVVNPDLVKSIDPVLGLTASVACGAVHLTHKARTGKKSLESEPLYYLHSVKKSGLV